jgi:hypothetical protein
MPEIHRKKAIWAELFDFHYESDLPFVRCQGMEVG